MGKSERGGSIRLGDLQPSRAVTLNSRQPTPALINSGGRSAHGQPSATNIETSTVHGWSFFLPDRAGSCERLQTSPVTQSGHSALSETGSKSARCAIVLLHINGLCSDESSGWIAASGGKGNGLRCVLSVDIDNYRRSARSWGMENSHQTILDPATQAPFEVWLAIPSKARAPRMDYSPPRIARFSATALIDGIEAHQIDGVTVRVTNVAVP
ncbi:MAG TPA: hypothetical protein PKG49_10655 [Nitrosomonas mobilis]|nr:hypothetical protein [Nitrosomonas mobilis]